MLRPMSSMPEPLHPVARGLAAPAGALASYPPVERWDDWETYDAAAWPKKVKRRFALIPTICFNCEAACGLLAYVDKSTGRIEKFEGNPVHPGSRGRNCAKGPATLNQVNDPERIRYPLRRKGRARRRRVGARDVGRGARRHRGPHPAARWSTAGRRRSCITWAGRGTS